LSSVQNLPLPSVSVFVRPATSAHDSGARGGAGGVDGGCDGDGGSGGGALPQSTLAPSSGMARKARPAGVSSPSS
jgi:hypothetical protein